MEAGADGKPVRFHVTIDGAAPGEAHGTIEFLNPGVQAYAFTFG